MSSEESHVRPSSVYETGGYKVRGLAQLAHDSDDDEGLSEDRYLKTRYVPPSAEEALEKRKDSMFDGGEAPLWATTLTEMYSMGLGIGLYFNLVIYVSIVMACCALINIPSFVIFNGSENVPGEEVDFLALDRISLANFGIPEEEGDEGRGSNKTDTGSSTQQIDVFGGISSRTGIIIISWTTFTVAIFILGFTLTWKHHVKKATRMFDINNVTMSDYTIYATGFPENATVDEIHAHFDSLYNLWSDDWTSSGSATYCCLDRKVSKRQKFLDPEERKKVERRVRKLRKKGIMIPFPPDHSNISPVRDNSNTEDDRYLNSWIAEISMAHPNGTLIRRYQKLTNKLREIRSMRGLIKKYTQGLSMEADNEKRKKAVSRLQRLELQLKEIDIKFGELYSEKCVGAFVVFNNEESFRRCLFDYKSSNNPFTRVIQPMPLRFSRRQNGQTKTWKLNVDQAPEPEDVVWEHLEASQIERRFRQILVGLILIFLLCCSLGVLFLIESQNEVISRGIPEEEFCQNDLPAFSFGTRSFPEDAILVRNQTRADEACSPGENYFIWQSSIMKPQTNTTKDPCFSPCVDPDGSLECTDLDGNNFQHNMIGRCFCLEKLNRKIEQEGFFLGFVNISRSSDKLCRNLAALIILAEGMTLISAGAVVIINLMLKSIMRRVTKLERFDSLSQEKSAVAIKIFIAQFFNTGIAILLTNLRMPFGEAGIGSLRLLSGQFSSLSTDWHTTVGTSIMYTMLFNIFSPHLATASRALLSSWLRKCCRRRVVIQEEMDDLYRPEDFDIETRYPVLLNTFAVTMLYGSGMPILFVFAFASYVFSYWIDKWLLLRVYKRPAFIDESLARLATAMVPVTVLFYLVMGLYMFTDHERIPTIPLRFFGDDSGTKAYQSAVDAMDKYDVLGLAQRSLQEHTFSLFILAIFLFFGLLVYNTTGKHILQCMNGLIEQFKRCCNCSWDFRSGDEENLPTFTGPYEYELPTDMDYELNQEEIDDGWRIVRDTRRGGMSKVKIKLRLESGYLGEAGEKLRTWEVISQYAIASYDVMANPRYQKAIGALEEGTERSKVEKKRRATMAMASQAQQTALKKGTKVNVAASGASGSRSETRSRPPTASVETEQFEDDDEETGTRYVDPGQDEVEIMYEHVDPEPSRHSVEESSRPSSKPKSKSKAK